MLAHDNISRLDIAVKDPTAVRVLDRVADIGEPPQQFPQFQRSAPAVARRWCVVVKPLDGLLEAVAADKAHRVEGTAIGVRA